MALNTLPHDINCLLLLAAARNDANDLRSLWRTCPSLRKSFFENKAAILAAAYDIFPGDLKLMRRFARFLHTLNEFGFFMYGSQHRGKTKIPLFFSCDEWSDALWSYATGGATGDPVQLAEDRCLIHRRNMVALTPGSINKSDLLVSHSAFGLFLELMERVGNATIMNGRKFPVPYENIPYKLRTDLADILALANRERKWKWFGKVLGVWDGLPDSDMKDNLDIFRDEPRMFLCPPSWTDITQMLMKPENRLRIRQLGFRGWELLSNDEDSAQARKIKWMLKNSNEEGILNTKRIAFEVWWKERRFERYREFFNIET